MTYAEAIDFLYGLQLFGANFGLGNTRQLAALMGDPQARLRFIHVAGTNGKGSTCALLESVYRAAGRRTGLFTSPHLVSFRERIQVNRQLIPEAAVVRYVQELQPLLRQLPADQHPTFFEVITVLALRHFADEQCDLVIWETGLGGRLDATNIVTPLASVITNIALDHQQWLGDTIAKIAAEKAGIIKPGLPILTAATHPDALAVIEATARAKNSPLTVVPGNSPLPGELALAGEHQRQNAALALATIAALQSQIPVPDAALRTGLATVNWPGRLQLLPLPGGRRLLLDGAHNLAGMETLCTALQTLYAALYPDIRPVFIFGALQDKEWPGLCRLLAPLADKIHTVPVASGRTAAAAEMAATFRALRPDVPVTAHAGLRDALIACKDEPFIVVTGSLYLVGEALAAAGFSSDDPGERGLNDWTTKPAHT